VRVLVAVPHYYRPTADNPRGHGSYAGDADRRLRALTVTLVALRQTFGRPQAVIDIQRRTTVPANRSFAVQADVVVCTTASDHLLDRLQLGGEFYTHRPTGAHPPLLGFECHAALRERIGSYDFYCYLEDDLVVRDPLFFAKLRWFAGRFGPDAVLMPNRYEVSATHFVPKAYVDGPINPQATAAFQDVSAQPELADEAFGTRLVFRRPTNPHSGSFFLTAGQMAAWVKTPHFLDRNTSFVGPLESAATLGVMRTFRVYKPADDNAAFLELEHYAAAFLPLIRKPG
jgi:hypothetical protein